MYVIQQFRFGKYIQRKCKGNLKDTSAPAMFIAALFSITKTWNLSIHQRMNGKGSCEIYLSTYLYWYLHTYLHTYIHTHVCTYTHNGMLFSHTSEEILTTYSSVSGPWRLCSKWSRPNRKIDTIWPHLCVATKTKLKLNSEKMSSDLWLPEAEGKERGN